MSASCVASNARIGYSPIEPARRDPRQRSIRRWLTRPLIAVIGALSVVALAPAFAQLPAPNPEFDPRAGNAAVEVIIPTVAPVIFQFVSRTGGDAPLVLRVTTMITNAWFDATAPYHPTAVGVYSRIPSQVQAAGYDSTDYTYEMNVAMLYASYHVLNSLLPAQHLLWEQMLDSVGLDPEDASIAPDSPVGIGNIAGAAVVAGRVRDGMNQLGDEGIAAYNAMPYMDYTNYEPVNTAYELRWPSRWQPDLQLQGMGLYKIQQFVTPQWALTEPYSYQDPRHFVFRPPADSMLRNYSAYRRQADEVLAASANLTDAQKAKSELFDNKIVGLGFSALFAAQSQQLSLLEFVQLDFLTNMAAFDAGIAVWWWKRQYDAVRPFSAIQHLYGDAPVTAWGGPGQGTVHDLPANEWKSYLEEADHPEYPSASTCFCEAHAEAARQYLGSDTLGWNVPVAAGSSRIEPGFTPQEDIVLEFPTWTDFATDCGQSRVWAGVHFEAAVDESRQVCPVFGQKAYDYMRSLIDGVAAERPPSDGAEVPWTWRIFGRGPRR